MEKQREIVYQFEILVLTVITNKKILDSMHSAVLQPSGTLLFLSTFKTIRKKSFFLHRTHASKAAFQKIIGGGATGKKNGATVRSRTADILITSEVLYQLSYGGSKMMFSHIIFFP
jgi:hypothetical protein